MAKKRGETVLVDTTVTEPEKTEEPIAQILQGFGYHFEGDKDPTFITPATPARIVNQIPREVLEAHAATGFARMIDTAKE